MSEPVEISSLSDQERASVAVFPLPSVVLFPGTAVALHLFEPRYRELARDVLAPSPPELAGRVIVLAALAPGWQGDYEGRPPLRPIGCAARVVDDRANDDGTFDVVLVGVERVALEELPAGGRLYRRAHARAVTETQGPGAAAAHRDLLAILRGLGVEAPETPEAAISAFADRVADMTLKSPGLRQEILEMLDVEARLRRVADEVSRRALGRRRSGPLH
jgi:Lon protease-like protein